MKKFINKETLRYIFIGLSSLIILGLVFNYILLPWYVSSDELIVPNVIGMSTEQAITVLDDLDLEPIVADTTYDEKLPVGSIMLQKPKAGKIVKENRRIYLFVSGGEQLVKIPMLKGKTIRDAKFYLDRIGLKMGNIDEVPSSNPVGIIFDQQFAEGTPVKKGTNVSVTVSVGEIDTTIVTVPNLIGKSLVEAELILSELNLKVGKLNYQGSSSLLPNTILDQYPSQGSQAHKGDSVDLFVTKVASSGEEKVE
ncbi:MAG TPA: PASTA domain-containing protein [Ignavibacteriaceae bacterium]|nr:PASTA domain-containing protein [Ignavibacteriaceae bacterium]